MLNEANEQEFQWILLRAGITVSASDLPQLRELFATVNRHIETLNAADASIGELEPGFRFEAHRREPE